MAVDRDLGVAAATAFLSGGGARGWDMLAATGARGLRLLAETGRFSSFLLTESHPTATGILEQNASGVSGALVRKADARLAPPEAPFDYVDVDPYGSPLPFLATAMDAVQEGGILAVTATDLMVLAGVQPGACERLYGSRPVRGRLGPEGGLRILLARLARIAKERSRALHPLVAYVRGHHLRAYLRVTSRSETTPPDPIDEVDPARWTGPSLGDRGPYGPMWLGRLFDASAVGRMVVPTSAARPEDTRKFLDRIRGEVDVDVPFYYEANELAAALHLPFPPARTAFADALARRGFRMAPTHARPEGFRTDAPRSTVEAIARGLEPTARPPGA
ncbi:MAG: hypothetical protein L3K10_03780 [Thermoplasmata archaeon]|nr:hypothetical protein [Thermoplasmata archaeon]